MIMCGVKVKVPKTILYNICFFCNGLKTVSLFQNNLNPDWKDFLIYESELGTGTNDDIE